MRRARAGRLVGAELRDVVQPIGPRRQHVAKAPVVVGPVRLDLGACAGRDDRAGQADHRRDHDPPCPPAHPVGPDHGAAPYHRARRRVTSRESGPAGQAGDEAEQRAGVVEPVSPLQRVLQCPLRAALGLQALEVPRVELAQVACGALGAEVLSGALHHPVELGQDLVAVRSVGAAGEELLKQPRVAQGSAREQDRRCAGLREGVARPLCVAQSAGDQHRHRQLLDQRAGQRVVGLAGVALRGVARMDTQPGHPAFVHEPACGLDALVVARAQPRPQLDGDRKTTAARRRPSERDRQVGVVQQRRPGAGLAHLGHRAAHVDVDQIGAGRGDGLSSRGHHVGVVSEQLHRYRAARPLVRVDAQKLRTGLLVAVMHGEARDHL